MLSDEWSDAIYCDCQICHGCHTTCGCACVFYCNCPPTKKCAAVCSMKHGAEETAVALCHLECFCEACQKLIALAKARLGLPKLGCVCEACVQDSNGSGEDSDGDDCKSYDACSLVKEPSGPRLESAPTETESAKPSGGPCREVCDCGCERQKRNCPETSPANFCSDKKHRRAPITHRVPLGPRKVTHIVPPGTVVRKDHCMDCSPRLYCSLKTHWYPRDGEPAKRPSNFLPTRKSDCPMCTPQAFCTSVEHREATTAGDALLRGGGSRFVRTHCGKRTHCGNALWKTQCGDPLRVQND